MPVLSYPELFINTYIHIFFLEVSDSDFIQYFGQIFCLPGIKGATHTFCENLSYYFDCGLTVAQIRFTSFYTFKKHQLKCWTARNVLPARSLGVQGIAGGGICHSVTTWLDWNSPDCSCRPQLEQHSCGALVKAMVILAKYWLCLSVFLPTVQTD